LCDATSGAVLKTLYEGEESCGIVAFSPNGKFIASGDGAFSLWDSTAGTKLVSLMSLVGQ
jgi:WD40 repeat protein